jgi:hypothetical protein
MPTQAALARRLGISRQAVWQRYKRKRGLCIICGLPCKKSRHDICPPRPKKITLADKAREMGITPAAYYLRLRRQRRLASRQCVTCGKPGPHLCARCYNKDRKRKGYKRRYKNAARYTKWQANPGSSPKPNTTLSLRTRSYKTIDHRTDKILEMAVIGGNSR